VSEDASKLLEFLFATNKGKKKAIKKLLNQAHENENIVNECADLTALLLLLLKRFGEKVEGLWIKVEVSNDKKK
jgi:phosphoribosyl-ATP pyrophosphohydrolase